MEALIKLQEVQRRSGLSKTEIYEKMKIGEFPDRVLISIRAVGWVESEIETWVQNKIQARSHRKVA